MLTSRKPLRRQCHRCAGYDPEEAIQLWKRMKENSKGEAPPEFLSTHPSNDTRIEDLKKYLPVARMNAREYGIEQ